MVFPPPFPPFLSPLFAVFTARRAHKAVHLLTTFASTALSVPILHFTCYLRRSTSIRFGYRDHDSAGPV